jgi:serine protease Do
MNLFDKARSQKLLSFTVILFTLSLGVVIGTLITTGAKAAKDNVAAPGASPLVIPSPVQLSNQFTVIAKQAEPSVVNISTDYLPKQTPQAHTTPRRRQRQMPEDDENGNGGGNGMDDFFFRFFGNPFGNGGGGFQEMPQRKSSALGSGVVVDKAGYILTNNHVVDKADRIKVKFTNDPTEYDAKVVGADAATDLAVIRLEGKKDFTAAKIGNSDAVQVGDWVLAIGSPLGFQETVTAGIISAKGRDLDPNMQFQHFLQTDAAINPGNSGGPLFNMNGEVIGINTAIASRSGGYQGIGFALPINMAANVYNQIIKTGKVVRGGIGIRFRQTDDSRELLRAYGARNGVFVNSVAPGGPADKAGIKQEDIVTAINGKPIHDGNELLDKVTATPIGSSLDLTVLREGKEKHFSVVVADLAKLFPEQFGGKSEEPSMPSEGTQARFGISIENLPADRQKNMGLKESGVLISDVITGSFADDIGMLSGDVLTAINRQAVKSVDDVKRIQGTLKPGEAVAFRVLRKGRGQQDWTAVYLAGSLPATAQ